MQKPFLWCLYFFDFQTNPHLFIQKIFTGSRSLLDSFEKWPVCLGQGARQKVRENDSREQRPAWNPLQGR
jgi:hypothetical protein